MIVHEMPTDEIKRILCIAEATDASIVVNQMDAGEHSGRYDCPHSDEGFIMQPMAWVFGNHIKSVRFGNLDDHRQTPEQKRICCKDIPTRTWGSAYCEFCICGGIGEHYEKFA